MHIINLDHLTINYAGREIFRDLTWAIDSQDRVGLVGPNGAGKSSLLKAVAGILEPYTGAVVPMRGVSVGYLAQDVQLPPDCSVLQAASAMPPKLAQVEAQLVEIDHQLGDPAVYGNENALSRVLVKQEKLLEEFDRLGGASFQGRVVSLLRDFGFSESDFHLNTRSLSGGQKKLVALIRLALELPDVLLLDEPDNHLDLEAKVRLEKFIHAYPGAVLIVSHDRYLLDETVTQIAELADGKLTLYKGNYSAYVTERELQRLRQQQMYVAQQKEISRIEAAIARFELWASLVVDERHIRQARSRRKMLDRMEANGEIIEKVIERRKIDIQLNGGRGSQKAIEICDLVMGFGDDLLFLDLNLLVRHGERVGLIGANGSGKSVLFKLILGEIQPLAGEITIGPSTKLGYYAQEHQTLHEWLDRTPIEFIRNVKPMEEGAAVTHLLKFLFTYEQTRQAIRTLSGGERSRLQLACLMLQKPNLLLLDEPTNNLDIPSAEALEAALEGFEGALLVISHDRYFLDQVVDQVVELQDGDLNHYPGGYTDYLVSCGRL